MSAPAIRVVYGAQEARTILRRQSLEEMTVPPAMRGVIFAAFHEPLTPDQVVARILADIREEGDAALARYAALFDGPSVPPWRVRAERLNEAWERTRPELRRALELAAERIAAFHDRQPRQSWLHWDPDGGAQGQVISPLQRVGIYAPNGRAPYPSSLLMAAIPARVAGVPEVVVATPPRDGVLNDTILAAAVVAGVREVYGIGGAQAIGALAYGTATVPRVDKILGPGNLFVVLAKRRIFGVVDIDQLPGPTETLLIADESADAAYAAADLLAQAEHDPLATAFLLTTSEALALAVREEIERRLPLLARREIISQSLAQRGGIAIVGDLGEALQLANAYAPEHLCLLTRDPWSLVGRVRNAGGIFVGEVSSEALGDYMLGPSHIMPTGGTARFASPLNVWDFLKITSVFGAGAATARAVSSAAIVLAEEEGLTAHAEALRVRLSRPEVAL